MTTAIIRHQSSQEKELFRSWARLSDLRALIAEREADFTELRKGLQDFDTKYYLKVGSLKLEIEELMAKIRDPFDQPPPDPRENAWFNGEPGAFNFKIKQTPHEPFKPSDELKRLFRKIAKLLHPDLALTKEERLSRQHYMSEANNAYRRNDEARLREILREWQANPDSIVTFDIEAQLQKAILAIAETEKRLLTTEDKIMHLKSTPIYQAKMEVDEAESRGEFLLEKMAKEINFQIGLLKRQLVKKKKNPYLPEFLDDLHSLDQRAY